MTEIEIKTTLLRIVTKYTKVSESDLLSGKPLMEAFDSLTMLEIVFEVEEAFKIKIDDSLLPSLKDFPDMVHGVVGLMNKN
jgi:acyl carrier protein